jgi:hypothetical protein
VGESVQVRAKAAGELACRPGSVHPLARAGGHPSRTAVADSLVRSTREHRAGSPRSLAQELPLSGQLPLDLAPGGVYRAAQVTLSAGGLLHHRFTLTPGQVRRRFVFCGTVPRVTPGRRYRPPCPAEPGPSSARQASLTRRGRPANSPAAPARIGRRGPGDDRASRACTRPPACICARQFRETSWPRARNAAGGPGVNRQDRPLSTRTANLVNQAAQQAAVLTVAPRRSGQRQR